MILVNNITGVDLSKIKQGTTDWLMHRAGVITASKVHNIIKAGRGKSGYSESRAAYMEELCSQVCTGMVAEQTPFKQAKWGHENEPFAREAYEARFLTVVDTLGLLYKDETLRCAASPDGLTEFGGLEIKCPFTSQTHFKTLIEGFVKPEYMTQMQYSMWCAGLDRWDFGSFDPRFTGGSERRLFVQTFTPHHETFMTLEREIPLFIGEMDEMLAKVGAKFGDQWANYTPSEEAIENGALCQQGDDEDEDDDGDFF